MKPHIRFEILQLERKRNRLQSIVLFIVILLFPSLLAAGLNSPRFEVTCFLFACASIALAWGFWNRSRCIQKTIDLLDR